MKRSFCFFVLIFLAGCAKHDDQTDNSRLCKDFVPGEVVIGSDSTASLEDVFAVINNFGLASAQASGYFYTSPAPKDSINSIINYLNTKPYIFTNGFSATPGNVYAHYQTGIIHINLLFWNMTVDDQRDWANTQQLLQLSRIIPGAAGYMVLKVPVGDEIYWLKKLQTNPVVSWADLDCRSQVMPL